MERRLSTPLSPRLCQGPEGGSQNRPQPPIPVGPGLYPWSPTWGSRGGGELPRGVTPMGPGPGSPFGGGELLWGEMAGAPSPPPDETGGAPHLVGGQKKSPRLLWAADHLFCANPGGGNGPPSPGGGFQNRGVGKGFPRPEPIKPPGPGGFGDKRGKPLPFPLRKRRLMEPPGGGPPGRCWGTVSDGRERGVGKNAGPRGRKAFPREGEAGPRFPGSSIGGVATPGGGPKEGKNRMCINSALKGDPLRTLSPLCARPDRRLPFPGCPRFLFF